MSKVQRETFPSCKKTHTSGLPFAALVSAWARSQARTENEMDFAASSDFRSALIFRGNHFKSVSGHVAITKQLVCPFEELGGGSDFTANEIIYIFFLIEVGALLINNAKMVDCLFSSFQVYFWSI